MLSAGARFRAAVATESPLQIPGAITAYAARMAEATGFKALYISGGGVAANSLGMPDLGISTMEDVLTDLYRITSHVVGRVWTYGRVIPRYIQARRSRPQIFDPGPMAAAESVDTVVTGASNA